MMLARKKRAPRTASIRLTPEDQEVAARLQAKLGVDFSAVVKMAIRLLAEREGQRKDFPAD